MTATSTIAVFAYDFPHVKTRDFLSFLGFSGMRNVVVLAAPWEKLTSPIAKPENIECDGFEEGVKTTVLHSTKEICNCFGFDYHLVSHSDVTSIKKLVYDNAISLGIIAGARIISGAVISLFDEGIVNFHPGKIPETSGLDSFYYTITSGVELGITAHFIDSRVDAGDFLFFEITDVKLHHSIDTVRNNNYQTQIKALSRFWHLYRTGAIERTPISRPSKNSPMTLEEKYAAIAAFPRWRAQQARRMMGERLLEFCKSDNTVELRRLLKLHADLIHFRSTQGWTPLIVACFYQSIGCVKLLIDEGVDPNIPGFKGTTPLMYAKTRSRGSGNKFQELYEILLKAGADPFQCDKYGKNLFHYITDRDYAHVESFLIDYLERDK